jgi:dTDP-L-rhamnose 4-epimerase
VEHGVVVPDARSMQQLEKGDWEIHCPTCSKGMQPLLIDETSSRPHTAYGISKYAVELLAGSLGRRYGIRTACMRYTYVQGARNSFFNAYSGICRIFAVRILNGLSPICYEDGMQRRDYINVSDVARANVVAMESTVDDHAIYNVGGGRPVTVLEFAQIMLNALESGLEPSIPGMFRVGDTRHTVSDISAMRNLGWNPTIPVEQNIREYVAWMSVDRNTKAYLDEAERVMRKQEVIRPVASKA